MKPRAVGIDLGTTYSSISIVNDHGEPEIIPNADGERLTPSAIFFDDDVMVVGQTAKDHLGSDPERVVMFVKRQMGNSHWFYEYKDRRLSPIDCSAIILKKLKDDAKTPLGWPVTQAVITVPAYFDDVRRRATITAGEIAGLKVFGVLKEAPAAA